MGFLKKLSSWFGLTSPPWVGETIVRRNAPVVMVGSLLVALFSGMLAICLVLGTPCPIDGFEEAANASPAVAFRYTVTAAVTAVILLAFFVLEVLFLRGKWSKTVIATVITCVFAFLVAMLWGIAESGLSADKQVLIFASIQFLVAGLIVFKPIVSLLYFSSTFFMFWEALRLSGQLGPSMTGDVIYLAILDIVVCWVVYGLFVRANARARSVADMSRRDELTGAKNRHYLRDDFDSFVNEDIFAMYCDIDDFKRFNDDYDHTVGDNLLKQFYFALREAFGDECTYRYGGDEFLVVSVEFGEEEFKRKLRKVSDQLALVEVEGRPANLTYSGGYVRGPVAFNEDFRAMLHKADENLLQAKHEGKNRIVGS